MKKFIATTAALFFCFSLKALALGPPPRPAGSGANYFLAPSIIYYSGIQTRSSKEEKAIFSSDMKLGYQIASSVYVGGIYQFDQKTTETSGYSIETFNATSKSKRASYGPSIGYVTPEFHAIFHYYLESKLTIDSTISTGATNNIYTGTGLQVDLGYKFNLWGINMGPQVSYKSYNYNKLNTNGGGLNEINPKLEESNFDPSFVMFFFF